MPPLDRTRVREALKTFDFSKLFIEELGWDRPPTAAVDILVDGIAVSLMPIAHKRGMVAFACLGENLGGFPDHATRQKIDRQATKSAREHIVIYTNPSKTTQVWTWVRREPGRPVASRQHTFHINQPGDALIQKLEAIAFAIEEEDSLTITTVAGRARQAFDVERVTKKFYDRFKKEHDAFLKFVKGIQEQGDREWYASVMLNRLMFVYFIQKKALLDGDPHYLRNRLRLLQEDEGKDKFLSFYRHFLMRLFHEGLGQPSRNSELDVLLGEVPYLNGGLFDVHTLEEQNPDIEIPDSAFEKLFDFFDAYQWNLDERPLRADNEINPDVLGYIFEKYINQKEMGAYYTKEDITEYIAKSAIVPYLFETAKDDCAIAFLPDSAMWRLLREDPDRYLFDAMRRGVNEPLPEGIAEGLNDVSKRQRWNSPAPEAMALPTETWREFIARRQLYEQHRLALSNGDVDTIDELVARNLDVRQFAQDAIENCEGPELLRAFYSAIRNITILDPTCGSGAFLFAALNILEPLYEACLERMESFVEDAEIDKRAHRTETFTDFREVLAEADSHPNRRYFILKTIVLHNLFGVDIMEEAVEICKLRLFLKLAAQVESGSPIEPLPDIDFNVRTGNTLVGFGSFDDVADAVSSKLDFDNALARIQSQAEAADVAFREFRSAQTSLAAVGLPAAKSALRSQLAALGDELDEYLAKEYGADGNLEAWRETHQPFHWFVEFFGVIDGGGFDVIIGNPPYVEYRTVRSIYTVLGFRTLSCGDLYALVMERALALMRTGGYLGMIIPVSIVGTEGFSALRELLLEQSSRTYIQGFAERPSKLFTGVEKRLAIWMARKDTGDRRIFSSSYRRWFAQERDTLFPTARYVDVSDVPEIVSNALPKIRTPIEADVLSKMAVSGKPLGTFLRRTSAHIVYYTRKVRYFVQFFLKVPRITNARGKEIPPTELNKLGFDSKEAQLVSVAALNSSLWFWFFSVYSDVRNVNKREIEAFPIDLELAVSQSAKEFGVLAKELMADFSKNSAMTSINYGKHGVLNIQVFRPRISKPIIDRIDFLLGGLYGLTPEEIDCIVNFDIKYRVGSDTQEDEAAL